MARLRVNIPAKARDSGDSDYTPVTAQADSRINARSSKPAPEIITKPRVSPRKKPPRSNALDGDDFDVYDQGAEPATSPVLVPKVTPKRAQLGRQIQLKPLGMPSLLAKPLQIRRRLNNNPVAKATSSTEVPKTASLVRQNQAESTATNDLAQQDAESTSSLSEIEMEWSIWCGSDGDSEESEDELPSPRKLIGRRAPPQRRPDVTYAPPQNHGPLYRSTTVQDSDSDNPRHHNHVKLHMPTMKEAHSRPASSSDKENQGAFLRFSPPRTVCSTTDKPITPPQSPSKQLLQSPSKTRTRIPTPPLRESLDGFWNADTVNSWNEQHSPKKIIKSPRKLNHYHDASSSSPTSSPRKQSPTKRTKAELAARNHFSNIKHALATTFLADLDQVITSNQIATLSASTGGVRLMWSKTLNSTAGRANWRKETTKTRHLDGLVTSEAKHFASIELAEKVIDDEHRLLNVLAHEFCHLANFMISGVKDQPHGRSFKAWGAKVTKAFSGKGVQVTTKHTYEIEYKYVWQCENEECGAEFKRHSKSIDPKRKVCGSCKCKLVQIKPVPRKEGMSGGGYAAFVKENFAEVKKCLPPGTSQKAIMEAVGQKYRQEKEKSAVDPQDSNGKEEDVLNKITEALEVVVLDD